MRWPLARTVLDDAAGAAADREQTGEVQADVLGTASVNVRRHGIAHLVQPLSLPVSSTPAQVVSRHSRQIDAPMSLGALSSQGVLESASTASAPVWISADRALDRRTADANRDRAETASIGRMGLRDQRDWATLQRTSVPSINRPGAEYCSSTTWWMMPAPGAQKAMPCADEQRLKRVHAHICARPTRETRRSPYWRPSSA